MFTTTGEVVDLKIGKIKIRTCYRYGFMSERGYAVHLIANVLIIE